MPNFLGRLIGLSFRAELMIMNVLGLVNSTLDWSPMKWTNQLEKIWNLSLSQESLILDTIGEHTIKTILSWVVITRIIIAHVYTFTYVTNIYSILTWRRPNLLLPWMILSFFKNVILEVIVIVIGLLLWYEQRFSILLFLEFVIVKIVPLSLAIYNWYTNSCFFFHLKHAEKMRRLRRMAKSESTLSDTRLLARLEESFHTKYKTKSLTTLISSGSIDTNDTQDDISEIIDDPDLTPKEKTMKILGITHQDIHKARERIRERVLTAKLTEKQDDSIEDANEGDMSLYFSFTDFNDSLENVETEKDSSSSEKKIETPDKEKSAKDSLKESDETREKTEFKISSKEKKTVDRKLDQDVKLKGEKKTTEVEVSSKKVPKQKSLLEKFKKESEELKAGETMKRQAEESVEREKKKQMRTCCPQIPEGKPCSELIKKREVRFCPVFKQLQKDQARRCSQRKQVLSESCETKTQTEVSTLVERFETNTIRTHDKESSMMSSMGYFEKHCQERKKNDSSNRDMSKWRNTAAGQMGIYEDIEEDFHNTGSMFGQSQVYSCNRVSVNYLKSCDDEEAKKRSHGSNLIEDKDISDDTLPDDLKDSPYGDVLQRDNMSDLERNLKNLTIFEECEEMQGTADSPLPKGSNDISCIFADQANVKESNALKIPIGIEKTSGVLKDFQQIFDGCYENDFAKNRELMCLFQQMERKNWNFFADHEITDTVKDEFPKLKDADDKAFFGYQFPKQLLQFAYEVLELYRSRKHRRPDHTESSQTDTNLSHRQIGRKFYEDEKFAGCRKQKRPSSKSSDMKLSDGKKSKKYFYKPRKHSENANTSKTSSRESIRNDKKSSVPKTSVKSLATSNSQKLLINSRSSSSNSCACVLKSNEKNCKNPEKNVMKDFGTLSLARVGCSSGFEKFKVHGKPPVYPRKNRNKLSDEKETQEDENLKRTKKKSTEEKIIEKEPNERQRISNSKLFKPKKQQSDTSEEKKAREMRALKAYNKVTLLQDKKELESKKKEAAGLNSLENKESRWSRERRRNKAGELYERSGVHHELQISYDDYSDKENLISNTTMVFDGTVASTSNNNGTSSVGSSRGSERSFHLEDKYPCSKLMKMNKVTDLLVKQISLYRENQVSKNWKKKKAEEMKEDNVYRGSEAVMEGISKKNKGIETESRKRYSKYSKPKKKMEEENLLATSSKRIEGPQNGRELDRTPAKEDVRERLVDEESDVRRSHFEELLDESLNNPDEDHSLMNDDARRETIVNDSQKENKIVEDGLLTIVKYVRSRSTASTCSSNDVIEENVEASGEHNEDRKIEISIVDERVDADIRNVGNEENILHVDISSIAKAEVSEGINDSRNIEISEDTENKSIIVKDLENEDTTSVIDSADLTDVNSLSETSSKRGTFETDAIENSNIDELSSTKISSQENVSISSDLEDSHQAPLEIPEKLEPMEGTSTERRITEPLDLREITRNIQRTYHSHGIILKNKNLHLDHPYDDNEENYQRDIVDNNVASTLHKAFFSKDKIIIRTSPLVNDDLRRSSSEEFLFQPSNDVPIYVDNSSLQFEDNFDQSFLSVFSNLPRNSDEDSYDVSIAPTDSNMADVLLDNALSTFITVLDSVANYPGDLRVEILGEFPNDEEIEGDRRRIEEEDEDVHEEMEEVEKEDINKLLEFEEQLITDLKFPIVIRREDLLSADLTSFHVPMESSSVVVNHLQSRGQFLDEDKFGIDENTNKEESIENECKDENIKLEEQGLSLNCFVDFVTNVGIKVSSPTSDQKVSQDLKNEEIESKEECSLQNYQEKEEMAISDFNEDFYEKPEGRNADEEEIKDTKYLNTEESGDIKILNTEETEGMEILSTGEVEDTYVEDTRKEEDEQIPVINEENESNKESVDRVEDIQMHEQNKLSIREIFTFMLITVVVYVQYFYNTILSFSKSSKSTNTFRPFDIHTVSTSTSSIFDHPSRKQTEEKEELEQSVILEETESSTTDEETLQLEINWFESMSDEKFGNLFTEKEQNMSSKDEETFLEETVTPSGDTSSATNEEYNSQDDTIFQNEEHEASKDDKHNSIVEAVNLQKPEALENKEFQFPQDDNTFSDNSKVIDKEEIEKVKKWLEEAIIICEKLSDNSEPGRDNETSNRSETQLQEKEIRCENLRSTDLDSRSKFSVQNEDQLTDEYQLSDSFYKSIRIGNIDRPFIFDKRRSPVKEEMIFPKEISDHQLLDDLDESITIDGKGQSNFVENTASTAGKTRRILSFHSEETLNRGEEKLPLKTVSIKSSLIDTLTKNLSQLSLDDRAEDHRTKEMEQAVVKIEEKADLQPPQVQNGREQLNSKSSLKNIKKCSEEDSQSDEAKVISHQSSTMEETTVSSQNVAEQNEETKRDSGEVNDGFTGKNIEPNLEEIDSFDSTYSKISDNSENVVSFDEQSSMEEFTRNNSVDSTTSNVSQETV